MKSALHIPSTGFKGLRENWKADVLSGFLVSLIALPLSLGIAGASNFPPVMGVVTAIIGGLVVSFFTNSELTIKGPAAGLIVIIAGAVDELGKGDAVAGWRLALGAVAFAGVVQVLMGILKLPRFTDFIPLSVVQGMFAAIGIILMSKQIHLAVGIAPLKLQGKGPMELLSMVPHSVMHMEYRIAIIGLVGLMIMFAWRFLSFSFFKKIPPTLVVLVVAVVLGQFFHLFEPAYLEFKPLISTGEFTLAYNADFGGVSGTLLPAFIKYIAMFAIVGSLESVLTVKATDLLDPYKRKSDLSRDLAAVGTGNVIASLLGGLPMISEVASSSTNVTNGGRTRWSNLFHGMFLMLFVAAFSPVIKMIPVAALAAILIFVGFRLASSFEFTHRYNIDKEQLLAFLVTIIATLSTNLLIGIIAGILTNFIMQLVSGVKLSHVFSPKIQVNTENEIHSVSVPRAAVFANYLSLKFKLEKLPKGKNIQVDFSDSPYVDLTVMENVTRFKNDYESAGGHMALLGLGNHEALSDHPYAAKKNQRVTVMS